MHEVEIMWILSFFLSSQGWVQRRGDKEGRGGATRQADCAVLCLLACWLAGWLSCSLDYTETNRFRGLRNWEPVQAMNGESRPLVTDGSALLLLIIIFERLLEKPNGPRQIELQEKEKTRPHRGEARSLGRITPPH